MITLSNKDGFINHFRCLSADVTANKHLPDTKGNLNGAKLTNGDELYCMDNGDTYLYDEENKVWLKQ